MQPASVHRADVEIADAVAEVYGHENPPATFWRRA